MLVSYYFLSRCGSVALVLSTFHGLATLFPLRRCAVLSISTAPYYQPETALKIFNRVMFDTDVSTGTVSSHNYSSAGSSSAWSVSEPPRYNKTAQCYVWDVLETCTPEEGEILRSGMGVVRDFVLIRNETVA